MDTRRDTPSSPDQNPKPEPDPMQQLQVIRIPPEFRAKLSEAYQRRIALDAELDNANSGSTTAVTVAAIMFLIGTLIVMATGLADTLLNALPVTMRAFAMLVVGAAVLFSVIWLIYAMLQVYDTRERRV